jgi:hypothetical protein
MSFSPSCRASHASGLQSEYGVPRHISACLDSNRSVEFNTQEHRYFDRGYSVTSHNSQDLVAERVLVNTGTGIHPHLLNSRYNYVSISHASHEVTVFLNEVARMDRFNSHSWAKSMSIEWGDI